MTAHHTTISSPIGELMLRGDGEALTAVEMEPHRWTPPSEPDSRREPALFHAAVEQLAAYFAGELTEFDLPLAPKGTPFQLRVWQALRTIPYGHTCSYGELAAQLGSPGASRAVGLANGRNPLAVVVPCHRVIGSDGTLTGYGGGLDRKRWLLGHESAVLLARGGVGRGVVAEPAGHPAAVTLW
jgi:methylated-DNA-[protein]-cysteine S-methyltransferase